MRLISILILFFLSIVVTIVYSQTMDNSTQYVNPFIGTADAHFPSKWEGHGRVYPGAVAPYGYVQFTPETRVKGQRGYDYADTSIYFFSCLKHAGGFPGGSSGMMRIMPVADPDHFRLYQYSRPFDHQNEVAQAGYYSVVFSDDGTQAAMTVAQRSGMFRFTFPQGVMPYLFIGGMGELNQQSGRLVKAGNHYATLEFSKDFEVVQQYPDGWMLAFKPYQSGETIVTLTLGISFTNFQGTKRNIIAEIGTKSFDELRSFVKTMWKNELGMIELIDDSAENKIKFYTALYRSKLIPWIVSDTDGRYTGPDEKIHKTKGSNQYGFFSPWDTFRTLHPLLCIIDPERQQDMILSMLDEYQQSGRLPKGPMTGNHIIPIIVDSYLKGIQNFDAELAYEAMKSLIHDKPFADVTFQAYNEMGYVPFTFPESVTKTMEYAYNDWVLAQFSRYVMHQDDDYQLLSKRSFNYRNLFDVDALFFLPRHLDEIIKNPGNKGYKEGDQWVYSMFIPHQPNDLMNLMGGKRKFADILDEGFINGHFTFDNEPVFHIPYLYNYAQQPHKTQAQLRYLMDHYFTTQPGGLPGNDDLGSLSSWFVFNALGLYPFCPGKPDYELGTPLFQKSIIHLPNGKKFVIEAENAAAKNVFVESIALNSQNLEKQNISHAAILDGGLLKFKMTDSPFLTPPEENEMHKFDETAPQFEIVDVSLQRAKADNNTDIWLCYSLQNNGVTGTKILHLYEKGSLIATKNCIVSQGKTVRDSIAFRLYAAGETAVQLEGFDSVFHIQVNSNGPKQRFTVENVRLKAMVPKDSVQLITFAVSNKGGFTGLSSISLKINEMAVVNFTDTIAPGEVKCYSHRFIAADEGLFTVEIGNYSTLFKVYHHSMDALIVDLPMVEPENEKYFKDYSGLENHGLITGQAAEASGPKSFWIDAEQSVVFAPSASLELEAEPFTMMLWVYSGEQPESAVSLFTKGDFHVMQQWSNKRLSFFAGGWGRGECSTDLPDDWTNKWHHVVGISKGDLLRLYIDGELQCEKTLRSTALKNPPSRWHIGRNEEFPDQRIFNGKIRYVKLFHESLEIKEILEVYNDERKLLQGFSKVK